MNQLSSELLHQMIVGSDSILESISNIFVIMLVELYDQKLEMHQLLSLLWEDFIDGAEYQDDTDHRQYETTLQ